VIGLLLVQQRARLEVEVLHRLDVRSLHASDLLQVRIEKKKCKKTPGRTGVNGPN
jgi:hypothetical protein